MNRIAEELTRLACLVRYFVAVIACAVTRHRWTIEHAGPAGTITGGRCDRCGAGFEIIHY